LGNHPRLDLSIPFADTRGLLPVPKKFFPPIPVGETPLWEPRRLREELGLEGLYLKNDSTNPTGSLKDRASYLVAAFAAQYGLKDIVVASTGNAGSSMAGVAAAAGLNVRLYLPASAPPAKIVQAMQYGADVIKVEGSYDDAFDQSLAYVAGHGGLSRNTGHNPLTVEGKKTVSLEIFRQLRASMPDLVYVPTGDGVILSGVYKGFEDLVTLGLADKLPELVCVQAEGSAAMTRALAAGKFETPEAAHTIADSISVDVPRGGLFALGRLQRHGGRCVTVSDTAIIAAQRRLSSSSGLFAEPAAAAAFAGLLADIDTGRGPGKKDRAVILLTGNGLKDIATAMKGVEA
ncbi:MAG: pyridoxal-phosphate dependent enzyme, partial [Spirochaetaceae bacterium]|nr:pyridoxal-phosphate dependent enzyme [Spirochaetaceae bacterium]